MNKAAPVISYLFHPLIIPSLGLLIILNSGTYVALLDPAAKRALMFIMALGTLIFPLMMLPVIQYRSLVLRDGQEATRSEQLIPKIIILALYIITFVYFKNLPLQRVIHSYVLSVAGTLFILVILNLQFKVSMHMAAHGGLSGLIIALSYLFQSPLEGFLMLSFLAGGLMGSARLVMGDGWGALLSGYLLGFAVVLFTVLVL
jgi:hypothetical protein